MKAIKKTMSLVSLMSLLFLTSVHAQVKIGQDSAPKKGTVLELNSNSDGYIGGLRLPNVWITNINVIPAAFSENDLNTVEKDSLAGAIIYNTNPLLENEAKVVTGTGVYYWTGSKWVKEVPETIDAWFTLGNAGTNPTNNFLGTTDNQSLMFRVNNKHAGSIGAINGSDGGSVSLGINALKENPFSNKNVAIGYNALAESKDGGRNIAIGENAIKSSISGGDNIAIGYGALDGDGNNAGSSNIAIGYTSLWNNQGGRSNIALGCSALSGNKGGSSNIAIGDYALYSFNKKNDGKNNIGIGTSTLSNLTTGAHNIALGEQSLSLTTTAKYNVAIGAYAMQDNATGENNIALGYFALSGNSRTGVDNIALGTHALSGNNGKYNIGIGYYAAAFGRFISGENNVAIGGYTLNNVEKGDRNVAVGYSAMQGLKEGDGNVAIGDGAMGGGDNKGDNNIAIGTNAMNHVFGGSRNNVAVGGQATHSLEGSDNTSIGWQAGKFVEGGNNINIGSQAGLYVKGNNNINIGAGTSSYINGDNNINIGNLIFGQNATGLKTNDVYEGSVGIGTPDPKEKLHVAAGSLYVSRKLPLTEGDKTTGNGIFENRVGIGNAFSRVSGNLNPSGALHINANQDDLDPNGWQARIVLQSNFTAGPPDWNLPQVNGPGDAPNSINFVITNGDGTIAKDQNIGSVIFYGIHPGGVHHQGARLDAIQRQGNDDKYFTEFRIAADSLHFWAKRAIHANQRIQAPGFDQSSDARLKTNIISLKYGLSEIMKLQPVNYELKSNPGVERIGFIAQDVKQVIPEVVGGYEGDLEKGETLSIAYSEFAPVLTKAIQEQQTQIEALQGENKALLNFIEQLEARLKALETK